MPDVLIRTSIELSHHALKHVAMNFAKSSLRSPHFLRRNYLGTVNINPEFLFCLKAQLQRKETS